MQPNDPSIGKLDPEIADTPPNEMTTRLNPPKKVRLACQRCRMRRIKCDGEVPACTNCSKAGAVCLDVDSQNSSLLVPRNFAGAAQARIQWLESIIRERLPDVDLDAGPQVDAVPDARAPATGGQTRDRGDVDATPNVSAAALTMPISSASVASDRTESPASQGRSSKRRADSDVASHHQDVFPERAHFIAVNLGMLSLNSESHQKHYLGSSSGRLFANLIGASPSSDGSTPAAMSDDPSTSMAGWPAASFAQDLLQQRYRSLNQTLRQELPRKQDALVLLQSYLFWMHPDFPMLDPASLFGALDALYSTFECSLDDDPFRLGWPSIAQPFRWNGRLVTPLDPDRGAAPMPAVAFIMFMVFNVGSIIRVRGRNYEHAPDKFYRTALQFSQDCFSQISLPSIQALIILVVHSMLTPAEVNLWTLLHVALAHCVELGIHREDNEEEVQDPHDSVYRQIRRYIFYTVYSLDRSISSIQGRPLGFRDETFDVKMPELAPTTSDRFDLFVQPSFSAAVARYSTYQFELDRITSDIKLHLYHLPGASTPFALPNDPVRQQNRVKDTLDRWLEHMPVIDGQEFPGIDKRQRSIWQCKLKAKYHTAMVLLYQPSQAIRDPDADQLLMCFKHALFILQNYQSLHDAQGLNYGWRSVQNIFAAGATVVYCFWMSSSVRQHAAVTDLTKSLRSCTNLLTLGGEWWPSVKRGQSSFGTVVDLTIQRMFLEQGPSKMPRLAAPLVERGHDQEAIGNIGDQHMQPSPSIGASAGGSGQFGTHSGMEDSDPIAWNQMHQLQEGWPGLSGENGFPDGADFVPEVETFLADFDRSKFSWSFPLDDSNTIDSSFIPDPHF